jgi:hypothetical protein
VLALTTVGTPIITPTLPVFHKNDKRKKEKLTFSSMNANSRTHAISEKSEILPNKKHEDQMSKAENVQKDKESIALTDRIKMFTDVYPETAEEVSNALDTIIRTCPPPPNPTSASGINNILTAPSRPRSQPTGYEIFSNYISYLEEPELGKHVAGSLIYVA